jgi:Domain of unknown function (DUF4395)
MGEQRGVQSSVATLFAFPDPVNEVSAGLVALGVVIMGLVTLGFRQPWILVPIAYGFLARVLMGPTLSPLGQVVTRVITPRLGLAERPVPGPPKRFAQGMGFVISTAAAVVGLGFGLRAASFALTALIVVAASLESGLGFCIGCRVFAQLMRWGVVPEEVCDRCANLGARSPAAAAR